MKQLNIIHTATEIIQLEEKYVSTNWRKDADGKTLCDIVSLGWYVQFKGSTESIKLWNEKPDWQVGDKIVISFENISRSPK